MEEYVVWGLPAGETERYMEVVLATQCRSMDDVNKVIAAASADGWHSFRHWKVDIETTPTFAATLNVA